MALEWKRGAEFRQHQYTSMTYSIDKVNENESLQEGAIEVYTSREDRDLIVSLLNCHSDEQDREREAVNFKNSPGYGKNFETLRKAVVNGDALLLSCKGKKTGDPVVVVCAGYGDPDGEFTIVPLAKMFDGNPYDEVEPPK